MTDTTTEPGVSRRTLIKAGAWSVPVLAAATAVPAAVASDATTATVTATPASILAGNDVAFTITGKKNNAPADLPSTITFIFSGTTKATGVTGVTGLTLASGSPTTGGTVVYNVTGQLSQVGITFTGLSGGSVSATVLGTTGAATITPVATSAVVNWSSNGTTTGNAMKTGDTLTFTGTSFLAGGLPAYLPAGTTITVTSGGTSTGVTHSANLSGPTGALGTGLVFTVVTGGTTADLVVTLAGVQNNNKTFVAKINTPAATSATVTVKNNP